MFMEYSADIPFGKDAKTKNTDIRREDETRMVVSHNLTAMNAQRQFGLTSKAISSSMEKLSSGYRINRAADDAAGLAISEKMRRQIRGLTQGVKNVQDGVSVCQVADGALGEVADILNRMEELSVKSANGSYTPEDRNYIQQEMQKLVVEINRIANETTFNEKPIFQGEDEIIKNADGTPALESDIAYGDVTLAGYTIGSSPFSNNTLDGLGLTAVVDKSGSVFDGKSYNLIFGSGSTSNTGVRITYEQDGADKTVSLRAEDFTYVGTTGSSPSWTRSFSYTNADGVDFTIKQKVDLDLANKTYKLGYDFENGASGKVLKDLDFMFHADTAYNNNDSCEAYYTAGGSRIDKTVVYQNAANAYTDGSTSASIKTGIPSSMTIVNTDAALAFSEEIAVVGGKEPTVVSVGYYNDIDEWDYYNAALDTNLGKDAVRHDLGFSMIWDLGSVGVGAASAGNVSLKYGISPTTGNPNLAGVTITKSNNPIIEHHAVNPLWIQAGPNAGEGMELTIGEMNDTVLGVRDIDVSTQEGAKSALKKVANAQNILMSNRSEIGAWQNRLEHTINNQNNVVENTQAAESQIRDTDMALEMVKFSNRNILAQAGQAMMAQANQSNQGVLSLLQ